MKKFVYNNICELTNTLCEALGILSKTNNEYEYNELKTGINSFIHSIVNYITPLDECSDLKNSVEYIQCEINDNNFNIIDLQKLTELVKKSLDKIYCNNFDPDELKNEKDFIKYLDMLNWAADRYCIFIASADTPCGSPKFTYDVGELLCGIGTKINLCDKYRCSYVAIVDSGELIAEEISADDQVVVKKQINDIKIEISSVGFTVSRFHRDVTIKLIFDEHKIKIFKATDMRNARGLTFMVYDKFKHQILDFVSFDTYSPELTYRRKELNVLEKVIDDNPDIVFVNFDIDRFPLDKLTKNEKYIFETAIDLQSIIENPNLKTELNTRIKDFDGIKEVLTMPEAYIGVDGARRYKDCSGKYLNIVNGHRKTICQPRKFKRTIYVLGLCTDMGVGVSDEDTYASQLQILLNKYAEDKGFIVENYAYGLYNTDDQNEELIKIFYSLPTKPGDIVVNFGQNYNIPIDDWYKYGEKYFDLVHYTWGAHKVIAESIFKGLNEANFFEEYLNREGSKKNQLPLKLNLSDNDVIKLNEYKNKLYNLWENEMNSSENVGAIVMNCNPFTLGHKYLIEEAAKQCEELIIFVVQEDKSFFSFEDRIKLVQEGTRDLNNVHVIESGRFIISSLTFHSYFNKSELQDRVIDTSDDVMLFVNEIAPVANIKKRFVGEEPLDNVTNQYNRTMEKILPIHGMEFVEIPRKTVGENYISASKVREMLKEGKWNELKEFVPLTTYKYLRERFN